MLATYIKWSYHKFACAPVLMLLTSFGVVLLCKHHIKQVRSAKENPVSLLFFSCVFSCVFHMPSCSSLFLYLILAHSHSNHLALLWMNWIADAPISLPARR